MLLSPQILARSRRAVVAGGGAPVFLPSDLTALEMWLKGGDNAGSDGSNITTWSDASGHSRNCAGGASSGGGAPQVAAANLNGINTVHMQASLQTLFSVPNFFASFAAGAAIIVAKTSADPTVSTADHGILKFGSQGGGNINNHYPFSGDHTIYDDFGSTARVTIGDPTGTVTLSNWHLVSFHAANNNRAVYFNGTSFFTSASNTVGWTVSGQIGSNAGGARWFDGWIAEIVFVSEFLGTSDRQKIEGYLAYKWGLQSQLPGGHPYKTTPP